MVETLTAAPKQQPTYVTQDDLAQYQQSQQKKSDGKFQEWEHLRGSDGQFIKMNGDVDVTQPDGTKKRGTVMQFTAEGPRIQYEDGTYAVIPLDQVTKIVSAAPTRVATIPKTSKMSLKAHTSRYPVDTPEEADAWNTWKDQVVGNIGADQECANAAAEMVRTGKHPGGDGGCIGAEDGELSALLVAMHTNGVASLKTARDTMSDDELAVGVWAASVLGMPLDAQVKKTAAKKTAKKAKGKVNTGVSRRKPTLTPSKTPSATRNNKPSAITVDKQKRAAAKDRQRQVAAQSQVRAQQIRTSIQNKKAASAPAKGTPVAKAHAASALTAANWTEWMHPRDGHGQFIEVNAVVNVKGDDGKQRRGTVKKLTRNGPQIEYDDDQSLEIIAPDELNRVEVAPKAAARIDFSANRPTKNAAPAAPAAEKADFSNWSESQISIRLSDLQDNSERTPAEDKQLLDLKAEIAKRDSDSAARREKYAYKPEAAKPAARKPAAAKPAAPSAAPAAPSVAPKKKMDFDTVMAGDHDAKLGIPAGTDETTAKKIRAYALMHGTSTQKFKDGRDRMLGKKKAVGTRASAELSVDTVANSWVPVIDSVMSPPVTAGMWDRASRIFEDWKHPRDSKGQFIEVGAIVDVQLGNGGKARGKVVRLTERGPLVEMQFGKPGLVRSDQITVAPKALGRLNDDIPIPAPDIERSPDQVDVWAAETDISGLAGNVHDFEDGAPSLKSGWDDPQWEDKFELRHWRDRVFDDEQVLTDNEWARVHWLERRIAAGEENGSVDLPVTDVLPPRPTDLPQQLADQGISAENIASFSERGDVATIRVISPSGEITDVDFPGVSLPELWEALKRSPVTSDFDWE